MFKNENKKEQNKNVVHKNEHFPFDGCYRHFAHVVQYAGVHIGCSNIYVVNEKLYVYTLTYG